MSILLFGRWKWAEFWRFSWFWHRKKGAILRFVVVWTGNRWNAATQVDRCCHLGFVAWISLMQFITHPTLKVCEEASPTLQDPRAPAIAGAEPLPWLCRSRADPLHSHKKFAVPHCKLISIKYSLEISHKDSHIKVYLTGVVTGDVYSLPLSLVLLPWLLSHFHFTVKYWRILASFYKWHWFFPRKKMGEKVVGFFFDPCYTMMSQCISKSLHTLSSRSQSCKENGGDLYL